MSAVAAALDAAHFLSWCFPALLCWNSKAGQFRKQSQPKSKITDNNYQYLQLLKSFVAPCLVFFFFFFRKEPEDEEEAEEAAPTCRMWTDGCCWRFSAIKAHTAPDRQAPKWEETDAHRTSSEDTLPLWIFGIFLLGLFKICIHVLSPHPICC